MRPRIALVLSALIVAAIPLVLIGNTLWVLVNPWFVEAQYALPGFPPDSRDLGERERTELAIIGLHSIQPNSEGVALLRDARLPSGDPAFQQRELRHMSDVRGVVSGVLTGWAIALAIGVAAALALQRFGYPGSVARALRGGALLTVATMALVGVIMLISFNTFFNAFHGILFEGDSWRFNSSFTLRRLYPDFFWGVAGGAMAGLIALQAGALVACVRRWGSVGALRTTSMRRVDQLGAKR